MKPPSLALFCLCACFLSACNPPAQAPAETSAAATPASEPATAAPAPIDPMPADLFQQFAWRTRQVQNALQHATPEQATALYRQHQQDIRSLLQTLNQQEEAFLAHDYHNMMEYDAESDSHRPNAELREKQRRLAALGLQYEHVGEGIILISVLPDYYLKLFGRHLPADEHDFLYLQTKHERSAAEDAGLTLSWDQLGKRLHEWENWLQQHPDSPRQAQANCQYRRHQMLYLEGIDNTPATDHQGRLLPEVKRSWQAFAQTHPNSDTTHLIESLLSEPRLTPAVLQKNLTDLHQALDACAEQEE
ncbi:hypothetical protein [Neisseria shayeganii]|nr:hypothetical protein [Neisseria shayeganii]